MRAGVEETRMVETVAEFDGIRLNWAVGMSMTFKGDGKRLRKSSVCFQTYLHPSIHPSTSPRIRSNRSTLVLPRSIHSFLRSLLSSSLLFSSPLFSPLSSSTSTQLFILLDHRLINRPPPFDRPTERTIHTPNHPSCTPPSHRNSRPASSIHTFHRTIDIDHPNQILHPTPSGRLRDKRVLNRSPPPPPPGLPPHLLPCAHSLPLLQPPLETNRPSNSVHSIIPLVLIYYPPPRYSHCSV